MWPNYPRAEFVGKAETVCSSTELQRNTWDELGGQCYVIPSFLFLLSFMETDLMYFPLPKKTIKRPPPLQTTECRHF